MEQFSLEEINFLRHLLEDRLDTVMVGRDILSIFGEVSLTIHQSDLLQSIKAKLLLQSSY